ncbi:sulfate adenylyltransferase subunit CysD [Alphaproteobacteria bacterium]|nr:sulfate adenylyltransferase subunit CysD [Alphaproteobacteria bacterium]
MINIDTHLDALEAESVFIIREAYNKIKPLALLWSLGKDSGVLIWLVKKAFFGHVPFMCLHIDTGKKFPEMYKFREEYTSKWNLRLEVGFCPPLEEMDSSLPPAARSAARKTAGLKEKIKQLELNGLISGIRRDEEATRAKERVFSRRDISGAWEHKNQYPEFWNHYNTEIKTGEHLRVHPLLNWTELDIWYYIKRESIPVVPLYFSINGKRYRSLGDKDITNPIISEAATIDNIISELIKTKISERSGRAMDHESEDVFEKLRKDGYL